MNHRENERKSTANIQFTWWVKGNKKGCKPAGVDRMELEFLDEVIDRTLPDNAMMKIITYQTQIKRVQVNLHLDFLSRNFRKWKNVVMHICITPC